MSDSRFWRLSSSAVSFEDGIPASIQSFDSRYDERLRAGQGLLVGDLDELTKYGEIEWVGVIESVDVSSLSMNVNWRNAELTLKPTSAGVGHWRKSQWFNFAVAVTKRYMLDAIFADIFDEVEWQKSRQRVRLERGDRQPRSIASEPATKNFGNMGPVSLTRTSSNPTVGYVYLIWSQYGYKIGKAVNVQTRTKLFSVKLPFPIRVEHYAKFNDYSQAERSLHVYFDAKRLEGEWFDLNEEDIALIKTLGEPQSIVGL
jgi:hypothetical protein